MWLKRFLSESFLPDAKLIFQALLNTAYCKLLISLNHSVVPLSPAVLHGLTVGALCS